ncbi:MAG: RES domain-containing protein [Thermoleophilaceae bacterium]
MTLNPNPLPRGFPSFELGPPFGQWWKVHSDQYGPWYFSSDDGRRDPATVGRFDLPEPNGTLYVGDYLGGVLPEAVRQTGVAAHESQAAYNTRRLSAMPLDDFYGKRIADFTSGAVRYFGAPDDVAGLPCDEARPWARAAHAGGFAGILYRLREDPNRRLGLALFGPAGPHAEPAQQGLPQGLPVRLRKEVHLLFEGEYRGDLLPR